MDEDHLNDDTLSEEMTLEQRIDSLEKRCEELEKRGAQSRRVFFLTVIAIYAVFAALTIMHWAGHFMRHSA